MVDNEKVVEPGTAATFLETGVTDNAQAACVTVILTGSIPGMVTVIVATLGLQVVLAA